jgi:outer membrane protein assembly factor BamB
VTEDESRYQVTVHLPDTTSASDWTGEVVGPPQLLVLKTVNVVAAGKSVVVLDKANKKLWQAALTYPIGAGGGGFFREESQFGEGPCAERGDTLYVFDQAVLTAFELNSGNARWRLPSVGVVGLFFDDQDNVYVNTTSGNPDDIKYSRQIDVSRKTDAVLFKLEPKTGKTLWSIKPGGYISYLSGKFIYTIQSYDPNPSDADVINDMTASLQKPPYLRIARIRPSDGRILWEHVQERAPIDARFHDNYIELIFKREVQLLRYLTF